VLVVISVPTGVMVSLVAVVWCGFSVTVGVVVTSLGNSSVPSVFGMTFA
jgi:hypothetical protein